MKVITEENLTSWRRHLHQNPESAVKIRRMSAGCGCLRPIGVLSGFGIFPMESNRYKACQ